VTPADLRAEIDIELEAVGKVLAELSSLHADIGNREPTVREKTAAATFLAQFYGGIENILKRISKFHKVPLPTGESWHFDLFERFCTPSYSPLPALFDNSLKAGLSPFRRFRHVVYHSYSFELEWERMKEGIEKAPEIFSRFSGKVEDFLKSLM